MMKLFIFLSNLLSLQNPQMNYSVLFYVTVSQVGKPRDTGEAQENGCL